MHGQTSMSICPDSLNTQRVCSRLNGNKNLQAFLCLFNREAPDLDSADFRCHLYEFERENWHKCPCTILKTSSLPRRFCLFPHAWAKTDDGGDFVPVHPRTPYLD